MIITKEINMNFKCNHGFKLFSEPVNDDGPLSLARECLTNRSLLCKTFDSLFELSTMTIMY